jgi:hypothetical protein
MSVRTYVRAGHIRHSATQPSPNEVRRIGARTVVNSVHDVGNFVVDSFCHYVLFRKDLCTLFSQRVGCPTASFSLKSSNAAFATSKAISSSLLFLVGMPWRSATLSSLSLSLMV